MKGSHAPVWGTFQPMECRAILGSAPERGCEKRPAGRLPEECCYRVRSRARAAAETPSPVAGPPGGPGARSRPLHEERDRCGLFLRPKWVRGACDSPLGVEALSGTVTGPWC
ncbi:hypothetical protein ANANG_G00022770 [Anguilla anguilla]|uniref:Uncharacterized protein n=1 Tax=Anguilla anguilla TaxID=7936 RepID=A0A9D3S7K4_ANGAN|nr:hypothetical protein ANANG_G00022770 [Anguilla anguilla]